MSDAPRMRRAPGADPSELADELRRAGRRVFLLPPGLSDRAEFFAAVKAVFPLDPPLIGDRSWDALSDSLWGGLAGQDAREVAIIWPQSPGPGAELGIAVAILAELCDSLAGPALTQGRPVDVVLITT